MRRIALSLVGLWSCLSCHSADVRPDCVVVGQMFDSKDVHCTIPGEPEARRYEFIVRFSGSHDDTSASLQPSLDGQPLACESGSKKDLFAEDGDVSLYCRFEVPPGSGVAARLRVVVAWSHAQFTDFRLEAR